MAPKPASGDRKAFGDGGGDDRFRAVRPLLRPGEERIPDPVDMAELESGEIARDEQADEGERHDRARAERRRRASRTSLAASPPPKRAPRARCPARAGS